jgi:hypothetical protein
MRAALLFVASLVVAGLAIQAFAIAPANAEMRCFTTSNTTSGTWPCKQIASSYTECLRVGRERLGRYGYLVRLQYSGIQELSARFAESAFGPFAIHCGAA